MIARALAPPAAVRTSATSLSSPTIRWPSVDVQSCGPRDSATVPTGDELKFRWQAVKTEGRDGYYGGPFYPSKDFVAAGQRANERIWILDKFFYDPRGRAVLSQILPATQVGNVRIISLTRPSPAELNGYRQLRATQRAFAPGLVEWQALNSREAYPYVHDRFAIIDGELWHFGSTVGGAHETFHAYTRGFDAAATGMDQFFLALWKDVGGNP